MNTAQRATAEDLTFSTISAANLEKAAVFLEGCASTTQALQALAQALRDMADDTGAQLVDRFADRFAKYEATTL